MADHINTAIYNLFWSCTPAILAHNTLVGEVVKYGLMCDGTVRGVWKQFISDVILELMLFGYCVHRMVAGVPTVLSGRYVELRRARTYKWEIKIIATTRFGLRKSRWKLCVVNNPATSKTGDYIHPTSPGYTAVPSMIKLRTLQDNMMKRDKHNSEVAVFTKVSNTIGANSANSRPWFNQIHSNMVPSQVTGRVDFKTLVRHRADTVEQLRQLTEQARTKARGVPVMGTIPEPSPMEHSEHMITDGRDMVAVGHLQQDNEIVHYVTEQTAFAILQLFGVPPQALGHNVNSERLASSNRLTEMSIQHFRVHMREMKLTIETVLAAYDTGPKFGDCVSLHTINVVKDVIKPKRLAEMYACAMDLAVDDFDIELLRQQQQVNTPDQERAVPSEEEKDENSKKKALAND
jgi:hypothetical protein